MIENVGEIVEGGANGDLVDPVWRAKYGALAIIKSDFAADKWCAVQEDPSIRQWVKWRNYANIEGQGWIIPTEGVKMPEIGDVIGIGDSIEEAIKSCQEHAEKIEGFEVKVSAEALPEALGEISKGEEHGITFTDEKLPDLKKFI
jgi:hypothetical protein